MKLRRIHVILVTLLVNWNFHYGLGEKQAMKKYQNSAVISMVIWENIVYENVITNTLHG